MVGYLDDPTATAEAVHVHRDGLRWVHTGDFGFVDEDGYFHFRQRLKRIIKVSGVPVFPSQVEDVAMQMPEVASACAIGIPDPHRMHAVRLYVVPQAGTTPDESLRERIRSHCAERMLVYSVPAQIVFRSALPLTLVGKVDVKALEREAAQEANA
jgi:long-chain acyl-CoA synthetase